jgi:putative transposase
VSQRLPKTAQKAPSLESGNEWASLIWDLGGVELLTIYVAPSYTVNMEHDYIHEQHSVHLVIYHIIWCPKRRRKVLVGPVHDRLKQLIEDVVDENGWQIIQLAIQPDHVHLLLRSNPYTLPTDIARVIKGRSSHHLRQEYPHLLKMPSLWTRSTFYSTAGNVSSEIIQHYIEKQSTE